MNISFRDLPKDLIKEILSRVKCYQYDLKNLLFLSKDIYEALLMYANLSYCAEFIIRKISTKGNSDIFPILRL